MTLDIVEILKITIPALGAWLLAYLTNRRERQQYIQKREADQEQLLASQIEKQSGVWEKITAQQGGVWSEMTDQLRTMIVGLQTLAAEAQARAAIAEENAAKCLRESIIIKAEATEIKAKYEEALQLIEELKKKIPKASTIKKLI